MESLISIISILLCIVFGVRAEIMNKHNKELNAQLKNIGWDDYEQSTTDLAEQIQKDQYDPSIIFAPDVIGGFIAHTLCVKLNKETPIITGIKIDIEKQPNFDTTDFTMVKTSKWKIYVPNNILKKPYTKVLLVHDLTMSGDYLVQLKQVFSNHQIELKTLSILASSISIKTHKHPDYYWKQYQQEDFYFPWGKAK